MEITSSLMSVKSRTKMYLMFLLSLMINVFTQNNFRLDHFSFHFCFKERWQSSEFCHFSKLRRTVSFFQFYYISREILVDKKVTIKNICFSFLVVFSLYLNLKSSLSFRRHGLSRKVSKTA